MTESKFDALYAKSSDAIERRVIERITGKPYDGTTNRHRISVYVTYSAYETADDIPIDNLDEVAFVGKIQFTEGFSRWNRHTWKSQILENPTWLDLCVVANDKIKRTQDRHHVFLEGFSIHGVDFDGVTLASLSMGS